MPKIEVSMGVDNMVRMVKSTATPSVLGEIRELLFLWWPQLRTIGMIGKKTEQVEKMN